ncbi:MAG: hypothetical protein RLZ39_1310 [Bacteroidota bacterium]|jgi:hypothetical protein
MRTLFILILSLSTSIAMAQNSLYRAVFKNDTTLLKQLIKQGTDVNSYDGSLMVKVKAIEALSDEEKKIVFSLVDALVGKKN